MRNPEDVDDCMQAGYLKVWQKLELNPNWLADKPKRYIVQAVVFRSKAQRFSHQRHYRKLVYDARALVGRLAATGHHRSGGGLDGHCPGPGQYRSGG